MNLPVIYKKLTPPERRAVREEYFMLQKGMCLHCGEPLDGPPANHILNKKVNTKLFPEKFFDWPVHLHHSHESGETIGAVHCYCNAVLWQYHGE